MKPNASALSQPQPAALKVAVPSYFVAEVATDYEVVIDEDGQRAWEHGRADGKPLVVITSERAALEYLRRLQRLGISWICVGREGIDRKAAALILRNDFGVKDTPIF